MNFILLILVVVTCIMNQATIVVALNPIKIDAINSATFDAVNSGTSTIVVNYILDGAVLGASTSTDADFYVLQSLQDFADCNTDYAGGLTGLDGVTEPAISGAQTTTTLVNTAEWPTGDTNFCLRLKLMLQLTDGSDLLWHQVDFKFTVTVSSPGGNADVYFVENGGISESLIFQENSVQLSDGHSIGIGDSIDPTFSTALAEPGPFGYGATIPITINFVHPLDILTYAVNTTHVIPVDDLNKQLVDGSGNPISLRSATFVMDSINFATGIKGTLTITFPLILYQMPSVTSVRIKIPVSWTSKTRRNLRSRMTVDTESYTFANLETTNGMSNEVVEIKLIPYVEKSGAFGGFRGRGVVSSVCIGAAAALWLLL